MRSRSFIFIPLILALILLPCYFYLGWRTETSRIGWGLLSLPFLLIGAMPITWRLRSRTQTRLEILYSQVTYLCMGWLSFAMVIVFARDILGLSTDYWLPPQSVVLLSFLAVVCGVAWAKLGPRTKNIELAYENLPPELDGLKIAQISDLHISALLKPGYVEKVVARTNALNPDIIALTGDIGDGRPVDLITEIQQLKNLRARLGVFYCPGNHEYYWNFTEWMNAMRSVNAEVLLNQGLSVKTNGVELFVAGITDPAAAQFSDHAPPDIARAARGGEKANFKILLSHRPGGAEASAESGFDLQLSGHTHGGQFFPFTLVVRAVHRHALGAHRLGRLWLYVSPGTGSWGPFLRLGTTSEVTSITLRKK